MIADVFMYVFLPYLSKQDKLKLFKSNYLSEHYNKIQTLILDHLYNVPDLCFLMTVHTDIANPAEMATKPMRPQTPIVPL